ncbi:hypothetical protein BJY00DRAFT_274861 [Aspergillus carlsbadensis]|nr:hypothetical protein BJY00DRAFT_274861 [Aspergillus carlsbadensis]
MTSCAPENGLRHSVPVSSRISSRCKKPSHAISTRKAEQSTDQVQSLHEHCEMRFLEQFPAPRGDIKQQDLQMQLRLVEEMNRRRAIGERMYHSIGAMDRGGAPDC